MAECSGRKASPETAGDREKRHEPVKASRLSSVSPATLRGRVAREHQQVVEMRWPPGLGGESWRADLLENREANKEEKSPFDALKERDFVSICLFCFFLSWKRETRASEKFSMTTKMPVLRKARDARNATRQRGMAREQRQFKCMSSGE